MKTIEKEPQLRFPEFSGKASSYRIKDILEKIVDPVKVEETKKYFQIGIRSHGKGIFHKEAVTGKELGNKRVFWIKPGLFVVNIVFAWETAVAKTTNNEIGMIASHRFPMYKPYVEKVDLDYLLRLFLTKWGKHLLGLASPGGAGRNKTLGQNEFNKLKICLPKIEEQKKISLFLTSVDTKIEQLTKKQTLLEQYKKGVMQKLFSQEIRFKADDGSEYSGWEEKKLGELFKISAGGDINSKNVSNIKTDKFCYPIYANAEKNKGLYGYSDLYKITENVITITGRGNLGIAHARDHKFYPIVRLLVLRPIIEQNIVFFENKINKLKLFSESTGVPQLTSPQISAYTISYPSLPEQQKIADFLTSIDTKINQATKQLNQTQQFKNALLQQMIV